MCRVHGILYYRQTHGATESQNWRPIKKCMIFRNFRKKLNQPLFKILRITFWFIPEDNRMCWKLNKWKYVFSRWLLLVLEARCSGYWAQEEVLKKTFYPWIASFVYSLVDYGTLWAFCKYISPKFRVIQFNKKINREL